MARRPPPGRGGSPMRGLASPRGAPLGRGWRGVVSPGRGRGAPSPPPSIPEPPPPEPPEPPEPPPPPPPPEAPPEPAAPIDPQKKIFQDLLAKKVTEWDNMMSTQKHDERNRSFEVFKKISEDEVNLAARNISKNRLKEFIDLKIEYFDQLASDQNNAVRDEGLKKFAAVCEDEVALAKGLGPKGAETEKAPKVESPIPPKQPEPPKPKPPETQVAPGMMQGTMQGSMQGMMPAPGMMPQTAPGMMPQTAPGMMPQMMPGMMPQMTAQMLPAAAQYGQFQGVQMTNMQAPRMTFGGQVRAPLTIEEMIAMQMANGGVPTSDLRRPNVETKPYTFEYKPAGTAEGKDTEARSSSAGLEIDEKLKLLSQLESARGVLQKHPPGSTSSMADEIKRRMRKINRLQMQVIDEILGQKGNVVSDSASDIHPETANLGAKMTGEEVKQARKAKTATQRNIVVTLPEHMSMETVVTETIITSKSKPEETDSEYTRNTEIYPVGEKEDADDRPEVLWERPQSRTKGAEKVNFERMTHEDIRRREAREPARTTPRDRPYRPPGYGPRYRPPYERPYEAPYEPHYHPEDYADEQPYYHNEPLLDPFQAAAAFPAPTYSVLHSSHCTLIPMPFDMGMTGAQANLGMAREVHDVGVEVSSSIDHDEPKNPSPVTSDTRTGPQKFLSKSTIVINRKGKESPAPSDVGQPMPPSPPTANRTAQLLQTTQLMLPHMSQPKETRDRSNDYDDSLKRIAASVNEIVRSLSTLSDQQTRASGPRRDRFDEYDDYVDDDGYDDDDYDDYVPPRRREGKRPPSRGRRHNRDEDEDNGNAGSVSLWGWLCHGWSGSDNTSPPRSGGGRGQSQDAKIAQVGSRIRELIQNVIRVSNEVIEARKLIQQSGMQGPDSMQRVFAAEGKLWQLIDLEKQLASELAQYRQYDSGTDAEYFTSLAQAEGKIRRLIEVETQLANEIGAWRSMTQGASPKTEKTTLYKASGMQSSTSSAASPHTAFSPTSSSTGYTS